MATYIPGVEDKIPQSQPFVPDYKFLSDVLQVRQDRYDKNYKQLNDVYGKVVYADLTRSDNKNVRDQYANQLAPQIKQVSGLDLSLQENVDAAYGLFRPFYENEQIIKDITATTTLRNQRQKAATFKDSPIRSVREKYWDYGIQGLDIWEEKFKNADPQKALTMGLPQYIEDVDLVEQAELLLDEQSNLGEMSDVFISQDQKWIVKQKSGSLITSAPTGNMIRIQTKDGKEVMVPETKNLAMDYIKNRLMDDPKVQAAYHLRNYVDMTNHVKENSEAMGGDEAAKQDWIQITQKKYSPKLENEITVLNGIKEEKKLGVSSWESYAKSVGIKPGSQEDINYLNSLDELKMVEETSQGQTDKLKDVTAATSDLKQLLLKTYTLAMGIQMGTDMLTAASSYAAKTMTRDMEPNPVYTAWVENQYQMARIKYKASLEKKKENEEDLQNPEVALYRRKKGDNSNLGGDKEGIAKSNIDGDGKTTDVIGINQESVGNEIKYTTEQMKKAIKDVYVKNALRLGLDPSKFTPIFSNELMIGDGKEVTGNIITYDDGTTNAPDSTSNSMADIGNVPTNINEENVAYYPESSSMTWTEFNALDDKDLIESMFMNMENKMANAKTQFPSFLEMSNKDRSDINYLVSNIKGGMGDFVINTDEMASKYMDVQEYLVGADAEFKTAATDGGSILDKDGILIDKELWKKRYVEKWESIVRSQIPSNVEIGHGLDIPNLNIPGVDLNEREVDGVSGAARSSNPEDFDLDTYMQEDYHNIMYGYPGDPGYVFRDQEELLAWTAENPGEPGLNQMEVAGVGAFNNYTHDNMLGGRYWSMDPMSSTQQDAWGNSVGGTRAHISTGDMGTDADKLYDYMYAKINETMTYNADNAKQFGFNFDAAMNSMPTDIGQDMYMSDQHQYKYDENSSGQLNSPAVDFANQIFEILDQGQEGYSIIAGGDYLAPEGATLGQENAEMAWLVNEIYMEMSDNYGKNKTDSPEGGGTAKDGGLGFTITYAKNGAGQNLEAASYEITVTNDWLTKKLGAADANGVYKKGHITTSVSPEFIKDNTITVLVEKSLDHNAYKTGDRDSRWVMNELKLNDGRIERIIPGGGNITVYELSPGQYMYSDSYYSIVDGESILVPNINIQVPQYKIAELIQTQFEKMNEIAGSNLDLTKSYNVANNFID